MSHELKIHKRGFTNSSRFRRIHSELEGSEKGFAIQDAIDFYSNGETVEDIINYCRVNNISREEALCYVKERMEKDLSIRKNLYELALDWLFQD